MQCAHHVITHDAKFPYACKALGFKSRHLPLREVLRASGAACLAYQWRRHDKA